MELHLKSNKIKKVSDTYVDSRRNLENENALTMLGYGLLKEFPLPTEDFRYLVKGVELLKLASCAHEMYLKQNNFERRRLVDTCLSNLRWKDGTIEYDWKKPFDVMANYSKSGKWGGLYCPR